MENNTNVKKIVYSRSGYRGSVSGTTLMLDVENFTFKRYQSVPFDDKDYDDVIYGKIVCSRKLRKKKECLTLLSKLLAEIKDWREDYSPNGRILDGYSWSLKIQFCDNTLKEIHGFCAEPENFKEFEDIFFEIVKL